MKKFNVKPVGDGDETVKKPADPEFSEGITAAAFVGKAAGNVTTALPDESDVANTYCIIVPPGNFWYPFLELENAEPP